MDRIYAETAPLLEELRPDDARRLEAEMVYHSTRGERARGLAAAFSLVEVARGLGQGPPLAKALINAANSYRINGIAGEAEVYLGELIDYSRKHHLIEGAAIGMLSMAKLALAAGDVSLARKWLEQSKALPAATENLRWISEQYFLEARVSFLEGKITQALSAFSVCREENAGHTLSRGAANLAMEILLRVVEGEDSDILSPFVLELEAAHVKLRSMGLQDFETESLFIGLKAVGRESDGASLVLEYLTKHRRERRPPAPSLAALVASS